MTILAKRKSGIWLFDEEMCFAATPRYEVLAEDFGHDLGGIAGAIHAKIGELIGGQALRVKGAKTGFIAEERAAGHGHAAGEKKLDGRVKPEDEDAGVAKKLGATLLRVGSSAQGQDGRLLEFGGAAERGAKLFGFNLAKGEFAMTFEDLRNGQAGGGLNAFIEIHEAPRQLPSEERANGGLAGAHESGETKDLRVRGRTARQKLFSHRCE